MTPELGSMKKQTNPGALSFFTIFWVSKAFAFFAAFLTSFIPWYCLGMSVYEKCAKCNGTYQLSCNLRGFIVLGESYFEY